MRYGSIYLITNKLNNKKYVGQTIFNVEDRWKTHMKATNSNSALHSAIKKYGVINFTFEEICSCLDEQSLNQTEELFIKYFNSFGNNGYNLTLGGNASKGKFTPEVRLKMRNAKLGKKRIKVNQNGSVENKNSAHVQRLEGETVNAEYNPSTSLRQPKYTVLKNEIIDMYSKGFSSYKIAEKYKLDKSMIVCYLKKWNVCRTQSESSSLRNKNRYQISSEIINLVKKEYSSLQNKSAVSRKLNLSLKTVSRILVEKIV